VYRHLKHGMITVRPPNEPKDKAARTHDTHEPVEHDGGAEHDGKSAMDGDEKAVSNGTLAGMKMLSFLVLGLGLSIAILVGGL